MSLVDTRECRGGAEDHTVRFIVVGTTKLSIWGWVIRSLVVKLRTPYGHQEAVNVQFYEWPRVGRSRG